MKSEQEKAIYRLKMSINIPLNDGSTTIVNVEDIETALNIIKDMKVQEENYKNLIADVSGIAKELGLEEDGTIDEIYAKIKSILTKEQYQANCYTVERKEEWRLRN